MDTCILYQATIRVLGETPIASVDQRESFRGDVAKSPHEFTNSRDLRCPSSAMVKQPDALLGQQRFLNEAWHDKAQTPTNHDSTSCLDRMKQSRYQTSSTVTSESLLFDARCGNATEADDHLARSALYQVSMQDWFINHEKQQREVRRNRQIKYRQKQQVNMVALEESIRQTKHDIAKLDQRRRAFATAVPTDLTLWNVAVDYFRLFSFGLQDLERTERLSSSPVSTPSVQLDFLRSTMAPGVMYNDACGVGAVMRSWKLFSFRFQDAEVELTGLQKSGMELLIADTTTTFCITSQTLIRVFPHLCSKDAGRANCRLADKLLGQEIIIRGSTRFEWDIGYGHVTSMTSEYDLLTPMLELLGTLEDAMLVCADVSSILI